MGQQRQKAAKGEPKLLVYVVAVAGIKIYSTDDPDEAKIRGTEIVREALRGQDGDVFIPRAMVISPDTTEEEVHQLMSQMMRPRE